jgi:hypothetical protein
MADMRAAGIGALAIVGALAAGCGGGDSGAREFSAADQARATSINLRPRDLPAGWAPGPAGMVAGQGGGDAVDRRFDDCLGPSGDPSAVLTADSSSRVFHRGPLIVSARVTLSASVRAARAKVAAQRTERGTFCLKQAIEAASREIEPVPTAVAETTTTLFVTGVVVEPLDRRGPTGEWAAMRARVAMQTLNGAAVSTTSERIAFVDGRVVVTVTFTAPVAFPPDLEERVLATLATRAS